MGLLTEKDWAEIFEEWDARHPVDATDEETSDPQDITDEEMALVPRIPTQDELPEVVDYSVRAPGDFIVGGRLVGGPGRGPVFDTVERARKALEIKYGSKRVYPAESMVGRWAFLIKKA